MSVTVERLSNLDPLGYHHQALGQVEEVEIVNDVMYFSAAFHLGNTTTVVFPGIELSPFRPLADTGVELWRSDGTAEGTYLVKDIRPDGGSSPTGFANVNGVLYFLADDAVHGQELWRSDGTESGTMLVKDIRPGEASSNASLLTNADGKLFFVAADGVHGAELWVSDGTAPGTRMVKQIRPGNVDAKVLDLVNVDGRLFFTADDSIHGRELWTSDGTAEGTFLVEDLWQGVDGADPSSLVEFQGQLYFAASDGISGSELWKSDGSAEGTSLVADIYEGEAASRPGNLVNVAGTLFFSASDGDHHIELWSSDGTTAGTRLLKDINPDDGSFLKGLSNVNGTLYFSALPTFSGTNALWKSDGTSEGTIQVFQFPTGRYTLDNIVMVGDDIYFSQRRPFDSPRLWKTDGTPTGTQQITQVEPVGTTGLVSFNGSLYYASATPAHVFYTLDFATSSIIEVLGSTQSPAGLQRSQLASVGGQSYLFAPTGSVGVELYKVDPVSANIALVKAWPDAVWSSVPSDAVEVDGELYFTLVDLGSSEISLWKTDGAEAGTTFVTSFDTMSHSVDGMREINGKLLINFHQGVDQGLWMSDGSAEGTVQIVADGLFQLQSAAFFDGAWFMRGPSGRLWQTDGTSDGTRSVADGLREVQQLVVSGNSLYFSARGSGTGRELWKSDGTEEGTVLVKDLAPGSGSSNLSQLTDVNGVLFFRAQIGSSGQTQLWRTDGTEEGTIRVLEDLGPGNLSSTLANVNETLFFSANLGNGPRLYQTDAQGELIGEVTNQVSTPTDLVNVNGVLYFSGRSLAHGRELWTSDGTPEGTTQVSDLRTTLGADSSPSQLQNIGGVLYFTADDGIHGRQLWRTVAIDNHRPRLLPIGARNAVVGIPLEFQVEAHDPNGDALVYGIDEGAPVGAAIDPQTGMFAWTPSAEQKGTFLFTVRVQKERDPAQEAFETFRVLVEPAETRPALASAGMAEIYVLSRYSFQVPYEWNDGPAGELAFRLASTAPQGMTIDPTTGFLEWIPDKWQLGTFGVPVIVNDTLDQSFSETHTYQVRVVDAGGSSTFGLFAPEDSVFFLNYDFEPGTANSTIPYGDPEQQSSPVVGDWAGNGNDTLGLYVNGTFLLTDKLDAGPATITVTLSDAESTWLPLSGNWNRENGDSVALYDPETSTFHIAYELSNGPFDISVQFGAAGQKLVPLSGDWNGDGIDTIGVYDPAAGFFFLTNRLEPGEADLVVGFGPAGDGWIPLVGDWDGDGRDTFALFEPQSSTFFYRNVLEPGPADFVLQYGLPGAGWIPLAGDWAGLTDFQVPSSPTVGVISFPTYQDAPQDRPIYTALLSPGEPDLAGDATPPSPNRPETPAVNSDSASPVDDTLLDALDEVGMQFGALIARSDGLPNHETELPHEFSIESVDLVFADELP